MFKKIAILGMALMLGLSSSNAAFADQAETSTTTMENCGAYLFEWRPVDCGDGHYFAILVMLPRMKEPVNRMPLR